MPFAFEFAGSPTTPLCHSLRRMLAPPTRKVAIKVPFAKWLLIAAAFYLRYRLTRTILLVRLPTNLAVVQVAVCHSRMFVEFCKVFFDPAALADLRSHLTRYRGLSMV